LTEDTLTEIFGTPISTYTSEEATDDGFLLDLDIILKDPRFFLKYITTGLLEKGYWNPDRSLNIPNLKDLLNQAIRIFHKKTRDDYFVSGRVELPSGQKQKIFIAQNETGRYTAMLPDEY